MKMDFVWLQIRWMVLFFLAGLAVGLYWAAWDKVQSLDTGRWKFSQAWKAERRAARPPEEGDARTNLFFVETSCVLGRQPKPLSGWRSGGIRLNPRQACATYSTAFFNPQSTVHIIHSCPISEDYLKISSEWARRAVELDNVNVMPVGGDPEAWFKGTRLEPIVGMLNRSTHPVVHASDALRLLTVYKYGGTYLDIDFVLLRSLDHLEVNWGVSPRSNSICSGIFNFEAGHPLAGLILDNLVKHYIPSSWSSIGPQLFKKIVWRNCSIQGPQKLAETLMLDSCSFKIYPRQYFFPVDYMKYRNLMMAKMAESEWPIIKRCYAIHFWNAMSEGKKVERGSVYGRLANSSCPPVYNIDPDNF